MRHTKIVGTIGPVTNTPEAIRSLVEAGLGIARLNGSHADLDWHAQTIRIIRETAPEIPILLDIPGRKIRTVQLRHEPSFSAGDEVILTTDSGHDGSEKVPVNKDDLHLHLEAGIKILADDGTLQFEVVKVESQDIHCRAMNAGTLRSRKGINVPHVDLGEATVTDRDRQMVAFAREHEVDFIGISFVESAAHVESIRDLCGGDWPRIVAKIENRPGLENMDEILTAADAAMIDRGDLSVETDLENLIVYQKRILEAAQRLGKPVIIATEMLHSMLQNPFPTKAEVSDITNAVMDGGAATMLSGETAVGDYPVEAVNLMQGVLAATEEHFQYSLDAAEMARESTSVEGAMREAIGLLCRSLPITKIVAVTRTGYAARMISALRPRQQILAVSDDPMAARSFNLYSGTQGHFVDVPFSQNSTDHFVECLHALWQRGKLENNDLILVVGVGYPKPGNVMNLLQTHHVSDLVDALGWEK